MKLKERTFVCPSCGFFLDRDLNASINLAKAGSSSVSACGVSNQRNATAKRAQRSRKETSDYVQRKFRFVLVCLSFLERRIACSDVTVQSIVVGEWGNGGELGYC